MLMVYGNGKGLSPAHSLKKQQQWPHDKFITFMFVPLFIKWLYPQMDTVPVASALRTTNSRWQGLIAAAVSVQESLLTSAAANTGIQIHLSPEWGVRLFFLSCHLGVGHVMLNKIKLHSQNKQNKTYNQKYQQVVFV